MGTNYRQFEDVIYIAGVTFVSEHGTHEAGSTVEEAASFANLEVLVDNRFLYPVAPEHGYNYLPPHLFNHIDLEDEVMAKITGASMRNPGQFENGKPESVEQAEREAEQRLTEKTTKEALANAKKAQQDTKERMEGLRGEDVNPNYQDDAKTLKAMREGDYLVHEAVEDQAEGDEDKTEENTDSKTEKKEEPKKQTAAKQTAAKAAHPSNGKKS